MKVFHEVLLLRCGAGWMPLFLRIRLTVFLQVDPSYHPPLPRPP